MSRFFRTGFSDVISTSAGYSIPLTGSAAIWALPDISQLGRWLFSSRNASPLRTIEIYEYTDNNLYCGWYNDGTDKRVVVANSYFGADAWHHFLLTWTNGGTTQIFIDGVSRGTTASLNATWDTSGVIFNVGNQPLYPQANPHLNLAMMTIWNEVLTANEAVAMYNGMHPIRVRPLTLVAFWPIYGLDSPEPNYVSGGPTITPATPTRANDPPVRTLLPYRPGYEAAAVTAGGIPDHVMGALLGKPHRYHLYGPGSDSVRRIG